MYVISLQTTIQQTIDNQHTKNTKEDRISKQTTRNITDNKRELKGKSETTRNKSVSIER